MKSKNLLKACDNVINIYKSRGFKVTDMLFDLQFKVLENDLKEREVTCNTSSAKKHVAKIERFI